MELVPAPVPRQESTCPSTTASNIANRSILMGASPLFNGLSRQECENIAVHARPKSFARDEMLYMQGQPVRHVALIRTGSVKITQLGQTGSEVILWMYGPGTAIGLLCESANGQYPCSTRAMEPCTVLVWECATLQKLMVQYPQIRRNASHILSTRLSEMEERFREVATERVARRVALALLRLLKHVGKDVQGGVELSLSREELAQMTGTTLFTISRTLSHWGEMGFVSSGRESVVVRDAHLLELAGNEEYGKIKSNYEVKARLGGQTTQAASAFA